METAGVAWMWVSLGLRAPAVLRSSKQRPLWLAVLGAAAALTLHLPWFIDLLHQATGPTHLTALARNLFGVLTSAAVLDFMLLAVRGRHTYALYGLAGLVMVLLVWLDTAAGPHLQHAIPPVSHPMPSTSYWAVLIAVNLSTNVVCVVACWRYSRASQDRSLRVGLRLFGLGAAFAGVYWLLSAAYVGVRYSWIPALSPLLLGCYALARASAIFVPLGTAVAVAVRRMRILWQLWPLWRDLVNAVPDVSLTQTHQRGLALLQRSGPLDLRLYRIVIEIRDAILDLRAHIPHAVLTEVRDHLEREGAPSAEEDARVTACWLRIARSIKAEGTPPLRGDLTAPVIGGADLPGEIEFLRKVAKADTSPQIRRIAAHLSHSTEKH
ncbi:MAB_1171c family putative transporter [Streptomyces sp. NPDC053474]|uniref:MAB_1171c family putative transporter n=1 Tax=Streptomyces sp. NPDC053474 TaxID=3365704 RepID=UPI0037D6A966